jgi:hypothetical protein
VQVLPADGTKWLLEFFFLKIILVFFIFLYIFLEFLKLYFNFN